MLHGSAPCNGSDIVERVLVEAKSRNGDLCTSFWLVLDLLFDGQWVIRLVRMDASEVRSVKCGFILRVDFGSYCRITEIFQGQLYEPSC